MIDMLQDPDTLEDICLAKFAVTYDPLTALSVTSDIQVLDDDLQPSNAKEHDDCTEWMKEEVINLKITWVRCKKEKLF